MKPSALLSHEERQPTARFQGITQEGFQDSYRGRMRIVVLTLFCLFAFPLCQSDSEEDSEQETLLLELLAKAISGDSGKRFNAPVAVTTISDGHILVFDEGVGIYQLQNRNGAFPVVIPYRSGLPFLEVNHRIRDMTVDSFDRIYLTDDYLDEASVYRLDALDGRNIVNYQGPGGSPLNEPEGIALDSSARIYFVSSVFGSEGVYRIDDMTGTNNQYYDPGASGPGDVQIDASNRIYLTDTAGVIYRFNDMSGTGQTTYAGGSTPFMAPASIDFDSAGRIYVADSGRGVLYRFDDMSGSNQTTYNGSKGTQFRMPTHVHIDASDMIYVTDPNNDLLYSFSDMNGSNQVEYNGLGSVNVN